jgi:hypothetical protein
MQPEDSSPYTQEPATCPYPEPDQSSLRPHTQPLEDPFYIFYSRISTCGFFNQKLTVPCTNIPSNPHK